MDAIVYTSEAGHTKAYAELLGGRLGLPVYARGAAECARGAEIIYLGWLMGGFIKGYAKAKRRYTVRAVCGVGMSGDDSQRAEVQKVNRIPDALPLFLLQGGFELDKLHGIYKMMMRTMKNTAGKAIAGKADRTPGEDEMLELLTRGGNRVSEENLKEILLWADKQ